MKQYMKKIAIYVLMTLLAILSSVPAFAGHWVVDKYITSGETFGEASDNFNTPPGDEDSSWKIHKWPAEYSTPSWVIASVRGDWQGANDYQSSIYISGSFTPVYRWVPSPDLQNDPPPSEFYMQISAGASAIFTTNNLGEFDQWEWEVQAGGDDEITPHHSYGQYWYEQKSNSTQFSLITKVYNPEGKATVTSPTTHKLYVKSKLPRNANRESHYGGNVMASVHFGATPFADIKVNSDIEPSFKKDEVTGEQVPNKRDADGNISVDTAVEFKIIDDAYDELNPENLEDIKSAWTFKGQFLANPWPAVIPLPIINPQYNWRYSGPDLNGYVENSSLSYPPLQQDVDPSKASMNVYMGDVLSNGPFNEEINEWDYDFLKNKFAQTFPLKGAVQVTVIDPNIADSPILKKQMKITWHLPAENIKQRPPLNNIHPEEIESVTPAELIEVMNQGSSEHTKAGATPDLYNARYILLPNGFLWLSTVSGEQWLAVGTVAAGGIALLGVKAAVLTFKGVAVPLVLQFVSDPIGGFIAGNLANVGLMFAQSMGPYNATISVVNNHTTFMGAWGLGQVSGIDNLPQAIKDRHVLSSYAENHLWNGCRMIVEVVAKSKYRLYTADGYNKNGYSGPVYLHSYDPQEPNERVSYEYVLDPSSY